MQGQPLTPALDEALITTLGLAVAASAIVGGGLGPVPAQASQPHRAPTTVHIKLRAAIRHLPIAKHSHAAAYDRVKDFGEWASQGGGCDTRAVVLKAESLKPTTQNENCTVETGKWYSYYDATTYKRASSLQIDHTVPVENVWISGAWRWTQATRARYYNDQGDARTLVAVDSHETSPRAIGTSRVGSPPTASAGTSGPGSQ